MNSVSSVIERSTSPTAWIEVNLAAIRSNLRAIKAHVGPQVSVMAVVKANAYGHGMTEVARALQDEVAYFGVASLHEGEILRSQGISSPVLVLGPTLPEEVEGAVRHQLSLTLSDLETARHMEEALERRSQTLAVHIKVDTGMGRLGVWPKEALPLVQFVAASRFLVLEGLCTHFPIAEEKDHKLTVRQIGEFQNLIDAFKQLGIRVKWLHAANSAGILHFPQAHFNLVRPGLSLYGILPSRSVAAPFTLQPALSLKSRIALVKSFEAGQSVSYGCTFVTYRPTRIAVLPIGYSSGYPWSLSGKAEVLIRGKRCPVVGRICMDYTMVDLGTDGSFEVGDEVTLIGRDGSEALTAEELALKAQTIPYEIVTQLGSHLPRVYSS